MTRKKDNKRRSQRQLQFRVFQYRGGIRLRFPGTGKPPEIIDSKRGEISGWSASSRRRMVDFLIEHYIPDGWTEFGADLTIPPFPVNSGLPPAADRSECKSIWHRFAVHARKVGLCAVWRLEMQRRDNTLRSDLRGIPQPHYHLIGGLPVGVSVERVKSMWLQACGDRAMNKNAVKHAVRVVQCGDYSAARKRYLVEHLHKKKRLQIAENWGRHWGYINKQAWISDPGIEIELLYREKVWFVRFMRQIKGRKIKDFRCMHGIPFQNCEIQETSKGHKLAWSGGSAWSPDWNGSSPMPFAVLNEAARKLGKSKLNVWALKKSPYNAMISGIIAADMLPYLERIQAVMDGTKVDKLAEKQRKGGQL